MNAKGYQVYYEKDKDTYVLSFTVSPLLQFNSIGIKQFAKDLVKRENGIYLHHNVYDKKKGMVNFGRF